MFREYDLIVVGAGHAGCEAAAAAANMGSRVLLITMNMQTIAQMSCNPAMGGIAKGQIVREIDALGGYSGIVSDESMIQFRMLNKSKGAAMWSPRTQNDRNLFSIAWREKLESISNLDFWQDMVNGILVKNDRIYGVTTRMGHKILSKQVILTNGTFLNGLIHIGAKQFGGGRAGEGASTGITEQLISIGFKSGRMKTGTPPRIDGRSLDYNKFEVQDGDTEISGFSYLETKKPLKQRPCWVSYTNEQVHDTLRSGFGQSPMFNGAIQSIGPRYCPSIEEKINRFADKDKHQLFIEPEGWNTVEIYLNGFSTSLPEEIQAKAMRLIPGFEQAKLFRPGYAIEYDFFQPTQLKPTLETHLVEGLYFAGQINGTTGYEEAACQGLMAGINAHLKIQDKEQFILKRSEAYIGVLIDDLINKGTEEPYRMFTSRAEYRILLRQDNADLRLTEISHALGLASEERLTQCNEKLEAITKISSYLNETSVEPETINPLLTTVDSATIKQKTKLGQLIKRPKVSLNLLKQADEKIETVSKNNTVWENATEIDAKYHSYMIKEKELADKMNRLEDINLPESFDYNKLNSLSTEARIKLSEQKPKSLGQASRISGVSPSDISVLIVAMKR